MNAISCRTTCCSYPPTISCTHPPTTRFFHAKRSTSVVVCDVDSLRASRCMSRGGAVFLRSSSLDHVFNEHSGCVAAGWIRRGKSWDAQRRSWRRCLHRDRSKPARSPYDHSCKPSAAAFGPNRPWRRCRHRDRPKPARSPYDHSGKPSAAAFVHSYLWRICLHREQGIPERYLHGHSCKHGAAPFLHNRRGPEEEDRQLPGTGGGRPTIGGGRRRKTDNRRGPEEKDRVL